MFNGLSVLECPALGIVQEYLVLCSVFSVLSHVLVYFESVLTQLFCVATKDVFKLVFCYNISMRNY